MVGESISLKQFHGHLGPYVVIGYRMGKLAFSLIQARGKHLKALVRCGCKPPVSCMIDGIQFSTSCTLGKGNILVEDSGVPEALFIGEKQIKIKLKDSIQQELLLGKATDGMVEKINSLSDVELFEVKELG